MTAFKALQVVKDPTVTLKETTLTTDDLQTVGLLIKVAYSGINYKDALATTEKGGVIREWPMTPGIDLAGVVAEGNDEFPTGTPVLATGFGLGVSVPGGFSQYQRVPAEWLVKLPAGLDEKNAMIYGTAGFTAALAVAAITANQPAKDSPIAITGASGGVGSIGLALLAEKGYTNLIAVSHKADVAPLLKKLGAAAVVTPDELHLAKPTPLSKQKFAAVLDTVGGELLENLIPQISYGGIVALCGNASGIKLSTTVLPFILRGITLQGIDSVNVPATERPAIWGDLANSSVSQQIQTQEISLTEVPSITQSLLAGTHTGRSIIKL